MAEDTSNTQEQAPDDPVREVTIKPRAGKNKSVGVRLRPRQKTPPPEKSAAEKDIDAALAGSVLGRRKRESRKKLFKMGLWLIGLLLFAYLLYWLFAPFKGSKFFGVCKVFLELTVQYPQELHLSQVNEFGESVRIWYSRLDAFGEYRMEAIQCHFKPDPAYGYRLDRVTINRRDYDTAAVERFNASLPVVLQNLPDLTLPQDFPDNIGALKFDTDLYRRQIFGPSRSP